MVMGENFMDKFSLGVLSFKVNVSDIDWWCFFKMMVGVVVGIVGLFFVFYVNV